MDQSARALAGEKEFRSEAHGFDGLYPEHFQPAPTRAATQVHLLEVANRVVLI